MAFKSWARNQFDLHTEGQESVWKSASLEYFQANSDLDQEKPGIGILTEWMHQEE